MDISKSHTLNDFMLTITCEHLLQSDEEIWGRI